MSLQRRDILRFTLAIVSCAAPLLFFALVAPLMSPPAAIACLAVFSVLMVVGFIRECRRRIAEVRRGVAATKTLPPVEHHAETPEGGRKSA
jgi:hypothetical protein